MKIIVAAEDPSLRNWGLVKAEIDLSSMEIRILDLKLIQTEKESSKMVRVASDDLRRCQTILRERLAWHKGCSFAFCEIPSGSQSARGAKGEGMCLGLLAASAVPVIQVQQNETKLVVRKNASKDEMIEWAYGAFPALPWITHASAKRPGKLTDANEHLADAVAVLHAGVRLDSFRTATSMMLRAA